MEQEYITWNSEKYFFQDEKDLEKILVLDKEYEKHEKKWLSLSTVRAFETPREVLEYYFEETFPRQISWSFEKYELPHDMKISMKELIKKLEELCGKEEKNLEKIRKIDNLFNKYLDKDNLIIKDLLTFQKELKNIGTTFIVTRVDLEYIGDATGMIDLAFSEGADYLDEGDYPEVDLIKFLIDYE
ncbi:MAG: hypothetical protein ACRC0V_00405 [Fusobacteriaceae bacterium]